MTLVENSISKSRELMWSSQMIGCKYIHEVLWNDFSKNITVYPQRPEFVKHDTYKRERCSTLQNSYLADTTATVGQLLVIGVPTFFLALFNCSCRIFLNSVLFHTQSCPSYFFYRIINLNSWSVRKFIHFSKDSNKPFKLISSKLFKQYLL